MKKFKRNIKEEEITQRVIFMYKKDLCFENSDTKHTKLIIKNYGVCKKKDIILPDIWYEMALIKYKNKEYDAATRILKIFDLGIGFREINTPTIENDLNNIIKIRNLQYKLELINEKEFDFYSFEAFDNKFNRFSFKYRSKKYIVDMKKENGIYTYKFDGEKFKTLAHMIATCKIQNNTIVEVIDKFTNFKVVKKEYEMQLWWKIKDL